MLDNDCGIILFAIALTGLVLPLVTDPGRRPSPSLRTCPGLYDFALSGRQLPGPTIQLMLKDPFLIPKKIFVNMKQSLRTLSFLFFL